MIGKVTILALFVTSLLCVSAAPAPAVFYLKIIGSYKQWGRKYVLYDQGGYSETVYVTFAGSDIRNKCRTVKNYYKAGNVILGWRKRCEVSGSGVFGVKTAFGKIRGRNYDSKFIR